MTTWQEAARGIPVWPQALTRRIAGLADVLALDNADTQAAYLRRLAVALGCPEEAAGEGVRFYEASGWWHIDAGCIPHKDGETESWWDGPDLSDARTTDRLLALALAWPADKRVPRD